MKNSNKYTIKLDKVLEDNINAIQHSYESPIPDEIMFKELIDNLPNLIFIVDKSGKIKYTNYEYRDYDRELIIGENISQFVASKDLEKLDQSLLISIKTKISTKFDYEDSRGNHFYCQIVPVIKNNEIDWLLISSTDITNQNLLREKSLEHDRNFYNVVENSPNDIVIVDKNCKILYFNRVTPPNTVGDEVGKNLKDFIYPNSFKLIQKALEYVFLVKKPIKIDNIKSLRNITLLAHLSPLNIEDHQRVMIIFTDISDVKLSENLLLESEERYRKLVEDQTELIIRWKPNGVMTFVNNSYCDLFQITKEKAIGSSLFSLIHSEFRDYTKKLVTFVTPENPIDYTEQKFIHTDGRVIWHHWTNRALFDQNGGIVEFQSIGKEITKRKLVECELHKTREQLIIAQEMDLVMKKAGGIAQDLINLLGSISLNSEILLSKVSLQDSSYYNIQDIIEGAKSAIFLINGLLTYDDNDSVVE